jgi:chromate transporter
VVVLARRSIYDWPTLLIALITLAVLFKWKVPEPLLIAVAAVAGLILRGNIL